MGRSIKLLNLDVFYELNIKPGLVEEAFRIEDISGARSGNDQRGLLYEAGKLYGTSNYANDELKLVVGERQGSDKKIYGIYLAAHFNSYYKGIPLK